MIEPTIRISDAGLGTAEKQFLADYPEFAATHILDELRATDYARLDRAGHIYLDYTGGGLYADSQVRAHAKLLAGHVFGNPHSSNPTSAASTDLANRARQRVLEFFNASPEEYLVVFTPNASGSLKLVGESYPFGPGGQFALTFDNHNSVNGIREYARTQGAQVTYVPVLPPTLRMDETRLSDLLSKADRSQNNLFAYPAQSNFSGVQHSLEWISRAQALGWDVLLDAAAFVPTNRLDLHRWKPEFVALSFYKIFGYPTGVGCLLARRAALAKLHRPWFAGGTITVASVQGDRHYMQDGAEAFEDGTINYLALPALEIGLDHISGIGVELIHRRVQSLTGWVLDELVKLHHGNGAPVAHIYGPLNTDLRGGTIALNLFKANGDFIDHLWVEQCANQCGISLRTGCFCNPGSGELALGLSSSELASCFADKTRLTLNDFRRCIDDKSTGAVRISVGLVSTFADVYRFIQFVQTFVE